MDLAHALQRTLSLKRPQNGLSVRADSRQPKSPVKSESDLQDNGQIEQIHEINTPSMSSASSQEHIYDNLDMFRHRQNPSSRPNLDVKGITEEVKTRESNRNRLGSRPLTVHGLSNDEKTLMNNEFQQVFNQLKKQGSIRKAREQVLEKSPTVKENIQSEEKLTVEKTAQAEEKIVPEHKAHTEQNPIPEHKAKAEQKPVLEHKVQVEPKPVIEHKLPKTEIKPVQLEPLKSSQTSQETNRRRTVVGVQISTMNKISADETKPTPSWIEIAKQKQNKKLVFSNDFSIIKSDKILTRFYQIDYSF